MSSTKPYSQEYAIDWQRPLEIEKVKGAVSIHNPYWDEKEGGEVEMVQTHISTVFLTPRFVFKFKRPLDLGFADFRSLDKRYHYCREEFRLNQRLGSGIYLEVIPLWAKGEKYFFDGGDEIVDYAVVMKRLPHEKMMDHRLLRGQVSQEKLAELAKLLAHFHRPKRHRTDYSRFGSLQLLLRNWKENFNQILPFVNITIPEETYQHIHQAVFDYCTVNRALLDYRSSSGYIRDGHGDLRCEHIYLGEEMKIIDCIEFNDCFRFGDTASDLAFLLMDMSALGRPDLSQQLLEAYLKFSKDRWLKRLIPFYSCYRAFVRGKVLSLKLSDKILTRNEQRSLLEKAQGYFDLSLQFSRQMRQPIFLMIGGLMGTGKTKLAGALARKAGLKVFHSDQIRKGLTLRQGEKRCEKPSQGTPFGKGAYSKEWTDLTYQTLFDQALQQIDDGQSVILDASFSRKDFRSQAFQMAREHFAQPLLIECRLEEEETLYRLGQRGKSGQSFSDGRAEIYPQQKSNFETINELESARHMVLNTKESVSKLVNKVMKHPGFSNPPQLFSQGTD